MVPVLLRGVCFASLAFTLIGCSKTPAVADPAPTWSQLFSKLPGALISVWGASADDVWTVGGDAGDGDGPMVLHYDGKAWTRYLTLHKGDLWWIYGFAGGPVFMGGANGSILRYTYGGGSALGGKLETMATPAKAGTVFGIWGDKPDQVWAVGGAGATPSGGFIWRYDGKSWTTDPRAPNNLETTATVFKAWGTGASQIWFVGAPGLILHDDGKTITKVSSPTAEPLFTVYGVPGRTFAVGGDGVILENAGSGFLRVAKENKQQYNGVSARGDSVWAVGVYGGILRRDPDGGWRKEQTGLEMKDDFHGVWIDPQGGVWCAGGEFASPLVQGRLWYRGTADIAGASYEVRKLY